MTSERFSISSHLRKLQDVSEHIRRNFDDPDLGRLIIAAGQGNLDLMKQIVENSKFRNPNPPDDGGIGLTPLHIAASMGHLSIVKFLLPLISDKNPKTTVKYEERTPLHEAALNGHFDVVKYIVSNISDNINPSASDGKTVLHIAAQQGHLNVVSFYTTLLTNPNPSKLSTGKTPLHYAAENGHLPVVQHLCNLLEDKRPKDRNSVTPLHLAAFYGHLHIVEYFCHKTEGEINPSLYEVTTAGGTPLHFAAQNGQLPVVQHICSLLEDKNPKDSNDLTPLHLAAAFGHLELVKFLVKQVEDIHPKGGVHNGHKTPLEEAKHRGQSEVVKYFQHLKRKIAKSEKHVKKSTVVRGNAAEYDIDSVLQSLGIDNEDQKDDAKKKSKKKNRKSKKPQVHQNETTPNAELECAGAEAVVDSATTPLETDKEVDDECTICFEPRHPTYIFIPCGHATFCKDCALKLSQSREKRCPDCRSHIQGTFRVFGTIGNK